MERGACDLQEPGGSPGPWYPPPTGTGERSDS
jgi:hypothetical protein